MATSLLTLMLGSLSGAAHAQVWVAPRRPGQTIVRYNAHDWQTVELMVGEQIGGKKAGGVRLFFYEAERGAAERAAAHLEEAYRELCETFAFTPPKRFDYVVYGTYQEFLRTNLFPVQEGVLGATSTQGLEVALPYFGDHAAFRHTSTHELAHEFTIQKARAARGSASVWGDPVGVMPLWFVEGLAEYVARGPIDGDSAMRVRDLVAHPDIYRGYGLLRFWDDWPGYTLWTYAGGHARISFLEETYGAGTVQRLVELTPVVLSNAGDAGRISSFPKLVESLTGDDKARVAERFDTWITRRAYGEVLQAEQTYADLEPLDAVAGVPLALDASPDGALLAYRSISPENGRTGLFVVDPRKAKAARRIVADRRPGVESLHPIDPRNFDVDVDRIAYVAESKGRDLLVLQDLEHTAEARERPEPPGDLERRASDKEMTLDWVVNEPEPWWQIRIRKGKRKRLHLADSGIVAATSVALEPDGPRVAVVGLSPGGVRDLWVLTPQPGRARHTPFTAQRITDDVASERDVSWGPDGLVFSSDASTDGHLQLFVVDPDAGAAPRQITSAERDHVGPVALEDGRIVYSAYDDDDFAQLYVHDDTGTARMSDLPTGAFDPQPGGDGGVWALVQHRGRLRPAQFGPEVQRADPEPAALGVVGPAAELPRGSLEAADPYRPTAIRNWGIDGGFAAIGAGAGGIFGQLYLSASDRLRDHAVVLVAQAFGRPELTDAQLLYLNQHRRLTWGAGPFHALRFRVDRSVPTDALFQSGERFYGALGSIRYPLDRYVYLQLDQAVGGVSYFLFGLGETVLADGELNGSGRSLVRDWEQANPFPRWQSETTARVGIDTTRFHPKTGPVAGSTVLLEATLGVQPFDDQRYGSLRLDAQQYLPLPLIPGGNLSVRASAATSGLGPYARNFWLSSYDTLRAVPWGDPSLLGRHYWFANAELQIPLDVLLRFALANTIEGVAGLDAGAVSDELGALWDERILDGALGANFIVGPLVLRLHWARAIDVGAPLPVSRRPWVTNFSISWLNL
ncbi:MAG: tolB protein precursor protein [Myxococcales bacterium]|nr:tolB protein precursor protein [Myxococcales bacterium]